MIKDKIKDILKLAGKNQRDYAKALNMTPQNLNNKLQISGSFSLNDLINLADLVGGTLQLSMPNGTTFEFDETDLKNRKEKK